MLRLVVLLVPNVVVVDRDVPKVVVVDRLVLKDVVVDADVDWLVSNAVAKDVVVV